MTRIEKQTIINALDAYHNLSEKMENEARANSEFEKVAKFMSEKNIASGMAMVFRGILDEKPGTVTI